MSEHIYLLTIYLPIAAIILIFGMRYFSAAMQAKARLVHEQSYRQIAEKSVALQSETAAALASIQSALSDSAARLSSIEKILKAVE
jgi:hypothetical protein